jgi:hypothetical protein
MRKRRPKKQDIVIKIVEPEKPQKKPSSFSRLEKLLGFFILLLGGVASFYAVKDGCRSQRDKFESEKILKGEIESPPLSAISQTYPLDTLPSFKLDSISLKVRMLKGIRIPNLGDLTKVPLVTILFGKTGLMTDPSLLYRGIDLMKTAGDGCSSYSLGIIAKDDRIYASANFIDFKTEEKIGEIYFNRWKLYDSKFLDYREEEDKFEVIDRQGNIAFSISYSHPNKWVNALAISGYFIDPNIIFISNPELRVSDRAHSSVCILKSDSNWKNRASQEMPLIKSVFPELK